MRRQPHQPAEKIELESSTNLIAPPGFFFDPNLRNGKLRIDLELKDF